jgi:hypothetical protein
MFLLNFSTFVEKAGCFSTFVENYGIFPTFVEFSTFKKYSIEIC